MSSHSIQRCDNIPLNIKSASIYSIQSTNALWTTRSIEGPESMRTYLRVVDLYVDTGQSVLQDRRCVRGTVAVQFTAEVLPVKIHRPAPPSVGLAFPHTHLLPHLSQSPKCKTRQVLAMELRGGAEQEQTHGTKEHFRKHFHSVTFFLYCPFGSNFS